MYKFYNPNPLNLRTNDCVIRALCCAFNLSWDIVYKGLCDTGFDLKSLPNSERTYTVVLEQSNCILRKMPKVNKGDKRITGEQFALAHPKGTYILSMANHIVCCKDGILYDTWDCSDKVVYKYWERMKRN